MARSVEEDGMRHEESTLVGRGGVRLFAQTWRPDGDPTGAVVLSHGYAEHSGRYTHVAATLADAGWATFGFDHRGHGRSGGRRADTEHLDALVADLDLVVDRATGVPAGARPVLLGHSMGGGLAAAYAIVHPAKLSGLALSAPALGMRATFPAAQRSAMLALAAVAPWLGTVKLDAEAVSRDPLVVTDYQADPLNFHGKVPARTAREMLRTSDLVAARGSELTLPVLIMSGTADRLVPRQGARDLAHALPGPDVTVREYQGLYHEIFNEPEQDEVLADLVIWLDAHAPVPAHE
jgi:acylglycerol lipase